MKYTDMYGNELTEIPPGTVACEYCDLLREQDTGTEDGVFNDNGWWCSDCVMHGRKRTKAQDAIAMFATDYPEFALELKRLRKKAEVK